ncbi:MAG: oligopeptide/dipeptide ABC transporter, ATP-binding protein, C-terminal domain protein, partial [halophilic archaeon J07HX5]
MSAGSDPLLAVDDLHVYFQTDAGDDVQAVDGVSFRVHPGKTTAIVGESGSGKTVTSEAITRLFQQPPGYLPQGSVMLDGQDLIELPDDELRSVRGNKISHIFQNPQGALNPVYTVGWQLREAIMLHQDVSKEQANEQAIRLMNQVGIPEAASRVDDYPHEFSGGQKQRVIIAMALACEPELLIADEPTTALDVTIQAQILDLLRELQSERNMAMLFITHDLGVVAEVADRVIVMYAGKIMERGSVDDVFQTPAHPYTRALLECLPGQGELGGIPGQLPDPKQPPSGCRFASRCSHAVASCTTGDQPPLYEVQDTSDHTASCIHFGP